MDTMKIDPNGSDSVRLADPIYSDYTSELTTRIDEYEWIIGQSMPDNPTYQSLPTCVAE